MWIESLAFEMLIQNVKRGLDQKARWALIKEPIRDSTDTGSHIYDANWVEVTSKNSNKLEVTGILIAIIKAYLKRDLLLVYIIF